MANSNLSTYDFHSSNIRVITSDEGVILFCLSDVCVTLNLTNPTVMANQIKDEFGCPKLNLAHLKDTLGRDQEFTMITEPQLYFVMMRSRAKVAREFRQWICNEVLPSIRAQGAYTQKKEQPKQKRCWYEEEIKSLCDKNNLSDESFVALVDIANRAFKQGYAIALNRGNPQNTSQAQIENRPDRGILITESQAVAVDHLVYYYQLFKPDLLAIYDQLESCREQAQALCLALRDIKSSRLYAAATAPAFSVQKLKSFYTVKLHKNKIVTRS